MLFIFLGEKLSNLPVLWVCLCNLIMGRKLPNESFVSVRKLEIFILWLGGADKQREHLSFYSYLLKKLIWFYVSLIFNSDERNHHDKYRHVVGKITHGVSTNVEHPEPLFHLVTFRILK